MGTGAAYESSYLESVDNSQTSCSWLAVFNSSYQIMDNAILFLQIMGVLVAGHHFLPLYSSCVARTISSSQMLNHFKYLH
jgi:hypothetical protein